MSTVEDPPASHDCCTPEAPPDDTRPASAPGDKAGLVSSAGAVVAAILASACCWLPLTLVALGASTAGVSGFFDAYRPHFLGVTIALLGAGFYFVYIRKPKCAPGEACAVPNPRLTRLNKITLWIATALVVAFASFPSYVGALFGGTGDGSAATAAAASATVTRSYAVEGMTCEACASHIRAALLDVPGVKAAEVDFPGGTATVVFEQGRADDAAVVSAITGAGYTARPLAP